MVDIFALALSHGLLLLAAWRLVLRPDLDVDVPGDVSGKASPPVPPAARRGVRPTMKTGRESASGASGESGAGDA